MSSPPALNPQASVAPRQMQRNSEQDNIQPKSLDFSEIEVSCSHSGSSPSGTISTNDTASTVSLGRSSDSDDPDQVWATLGLTAIATLAPPARRRRLNTPSTDASSPCPRQSDILFESPLIPYLNPLGAGFPHILPLQYSSSRLVTWPRSASASTVNGRKVGAAVRLFLYCSIQTRMF